MYGVVIVVMDVFSVCSAGWHVAHRRTMCEALSCSVLLDRSDLGRSGFGISGFVM